VSDAALRLLEAILFAAAEPMPEKELALRLPPGSDLDALLRRLQQDYLGRGVTLERLGDGWAFRTAPDLAAALVVELPVERKLSRAAIETLAIIAYHQPVTRAEIEEIRGVALSRGTLDTLLEAGWIRPRGRRQVPGRPMQWATSEAFLDHFALASLDELPGLEELKAAGLLDALPAMASYGNRAEDSGEPVDVEEDLDEEALERRAMELLRGDDGSGIRRPKPRLSGGPCPCRVRDWPSAAAAADAAAAPARARAPAGCSAASAVAPVPARPASAAHAASAGPAAAAAVAPARPASAADAASAAPAAAASVARPADGTRAGRPAAAPPAAGG
jgi:segregation and condensation protein B